jgi:Protein of unknown function (DUF2510)
MDTEGGLGPPKPDWYGDPEGRHQFRYWDGAAWTSQVADDGKDSLDPLGGQSGPTVAPAVDSGMPAATAEYAKRGYKVTSGGFDSVTMERPATPLNWWYVIALLWLFGVGSLVYVLLWGIWGVHKTYRVAISRGPDDAVHELGDVLAVFDRDKLHAHRNRLLAGGILLIVVGVLFGAGAIGSALTGPNSFAADPGGIGGLIFAFLIMGVLPAGGGFALVRASRKATRALDAGTPVLGSEPPSTPAGSTA